MYRAFVWARRALNGRKRRFPARAGEAEFKVMAVVGATPPARTAAIELRAALALA